jgi:hypothetical protein
MLIILTSIPDPTINLLPVIVAGIINMAIGMLWYSPYVFGKLWIKSMQKTPEEMKQGANPFVYILNTIAALLLAYVLAHIVKYANINTAVMGVEAGFWVWLGFVVTTVLPTYLYEGRNKLLFFLYIFYQMFAIIIMGVILALWK